MKSAFIEASPLSFEDLHDKKWFENLFLVIEGQGLDEPIDEFAAQWWGTARMFTLPWLMASSTCTALGTDSEEMLNSIWASYIETNEFKVALWKTAESAYCSFYYAYECLLVSMISHLENRKIRVTERGFSSLLEKHFSSQKLSQFWSSKEMSLARELRNSIVHNGGKVTTKLDKLGYGSSLSGQNIKVSATDVRTLYFQLQLAVTDLIHLMVEKRS